MEEMADTGPKELGGVILYNTGKLADEIIRIVEQERADGANVN